MSVHVFFDSLYYFFFSTYNFAVSPSGSTPIESVIMMLLAFLTLFYTRAICCRESSLIRSCNRRQIHIVLIRSGGVNYICRIIVGRSGCFCLNLSDNSVMRGRVHARRTLKGLVADLRVIESNVGFQLFSGIKQYVIVKVFILLQQHSLMIQYIDETNFYTSVFPVGGKSSQS